MAASSSSSPTPTVSDATPYGGGASERPLRRRQNVGSLLTAYYSLPSAEKKSAPASSSVADDHIDRQGFDARRYFEGVISSGQLPDLVKRSECLDAEVKKMNGEMQGLVYENFSKFIRATDLIKDMKNCVDGLQPDIRKLGGNLQNLEEYETRCEKKIADRASQMEVLLKRQRHCRKLELLFNLPATLQRCLDVGAYDRAVQAYNKCCGFLRQYPDINSFRKVLEQADSKMCELRSALECRLQSPDLSADDAVECANMLLELGRDHPSVVSSYLTGRDAMLRKTLDYCFAPVDDAFAADMLEQSQLGTNGQAVDKDVEPDENAEHVPPAKPSKDQRDLSRPESVALRRATDRVSALYLPQLCDSVEGVRRLYCGAPSPSSSAAAPSTANGVGEETLADFVSARVEDMCTRISKQVEEQNTPSRILVSCIHTVRDALKMLHVMMPRVLNTLFLQFLSRTANNSLKALFAHAIKLLISDMRHLHSTSANMVHREAYDEALEEMHKTEQQMILRAFTALTDSEPLLGLLNSDRSIAVQFLRSLNEQLVIFFLAFAEACHTYTLLDPAERDKDLDQSLPHLPFSTTDAIDEVRGLHWDELFALALVRIGRHLEVKAITQIWGVAQDLFSGSDAAKSELAVHPAIVKAMRGAAQAVITHYALVNGQTVAHFLRTVPSERIFMSMREPREPRQAVEAALMKAFSCDAQLAHILGDPRKPRSDARRSGFSQRKSDMELELERQLARKLQVFAPIPFNRNGTMLGILRIAFKAFYEYAREETFAKFGLQQVQLDCAFFAEVIRDLVTAEDASTLDSLLDEVVMSASCRCTEPVFMESAIVETVCDEKKKAFKTV